MTSRQAWRTERTRPFINAYRVCRLGHHPGQARRYSSVLCRACLHRRPAAQTTGSLAARSQCVRVPARVDARGLRQRQRQKEGQRLARARRSYLLTPHPQSSSAHTPTPERSFRVPSGRLSPHSALPPLLPPVRNFLLLESDNVSAALGLHVHVPAFPASKHLRQRVVVVVVLVRRFRRPAVVAARRRRWLRLEAKQNRGETQSLCLHFLFRGCDTHPFRQVTTTLTAGAEQRGTGAARRRPRHDGCCKGLCCKRLPTTTTTTTRKHCYNDKGAVYNTQMEWALALSPTY